MRTISIASTRSRRTLGALLACAAIAACSRGRAPEGERAIAADLQHDLELASTSGIELAGSPARSVEVVSAVEQGPRSTAVHATRTRVPRAKGHKMAAPSPRAEEPAPTAAPEIVEAATTVAAAGDKVENPAPAVEPEPQQPAAEPLPLPDGQMGAPSDGRRGGGWGRIFGVVIRGAVVGGVDHCDERHRGRGPGGIASMPLPIPIGAGGRPGFPGTGGTFRRF